MSQGGSCGESEFWSADDARKTAGLARDRVRACLQCRAHVITSKVSSRGPQAGDLLLVSDHEMLVSQDLWRGL